MIRFPALVTFVRLLLGVEFVVNGLNWWVKLIGPTVDAPPFRIALIASSWSQQSSVSSC